MALMAPGSRMPMDRDDNGGAAGRREPRADRHGRGPRREGRHAARYRGGCGPPAVQPDWVQAPNDVTARRETTERPSRPCVVYPEVLGDRPERPTGPTHLSRLGGDALEHRDGRRIPQLDLERHRSQDSQSLRACPPSLSSSVYTTYRAQNPRSIQSAQPCYDDRRGGSKHNEFRASRGALRSRAALLETGATEEATEAAA